MKNTANKSGEQNLTLILQELHKTFDLLNDTFYKGGLPKCIITIQSKGKSNALGWFTPSKVWDDGAEGKHEINITAEGLKRDYIEIVRTIHHEMIHLYCHVNEIKDVSRGNTYHNKNFKAVSMEHGFYYEDDAYTTKNGWTFSKLTEESIEIINKFDVDFNVFNLSRVDFSDTGEEKKKKKSNIIKWVCGCGVIVRSSKDNIKIYCGECGTLFEKEEQEQDEESDES